MPVPIKPETPIKAAVSVSFQCRLLGMSRSHFYWHVRKGTFHAPLKLPNGRPYFTASMVEDIIKARETGVGVNGEYVLFYERQPTGAKPDATPRADHSSLIEGLKSLGISSVTTQQIEAALAVCFPKGTTGQDDSQVLRAVFRYLKRSGTA